MRHFSAFVLLTDVDDIKCVINFDFPNTTEDYVHRIGRTGRLDKKGKSFTFMSSEDSRSADELIEVLRESKQTISPELMQLAQMSRNSSDRGKAKYRYGSNSSYANSYQRQMYRNNSYGRTNNYNNYRSGGQRRAPDGDDSYESYDSRSYGNNRPNYRSNYRPNYESSQDYAEQDRPQRRGY